MRLVDDLAALAKAENPLLGLQRESVELPALFEDICTLELPQLEPRDLTLDLAFGDDARQVTADRDKLLQIFCNILQNACRYADPGVAIKVESRRLGSGAAALVEVGIENRGPEIDTKDLPFIFERFYRADKSRSRDSGGAGVGLAIVKELVEAHGGTVGAESGDGRTRVWVRLPAS